MSIRGKKKEMLISGQCFDNLSWKIKQLRKEQKNLHIKKLIFQYSSKLLSHREKIVNSTVLLHVYIILRGCFYWICLNWSIKTLKNDKLMLHVSIMLYNAAVMPLHKSLSYKLCHWSVTYKYSTLLGIQVACITCCYVGQTSGKRSGCQEQPLLKRHA